MGCKELIDSLRRIRDEKIIAIWNRVEEEAASLREERKRAAEQLRDGLEQNRARDAQERLNRALSEAEGFSRSRRLAVEHEIAERLLRLAHAALGGARSTDYPAVFADLVKELPNLDWKTVKVNPLDRELARKHFPGAEIVPERAITGGIEAMTADGRIRVDNTYEKRLERMWSELIPELMKDVHEELSKQGPARKD